MPSSFLSMDFCCLDKFVSSVRIVNFLFSVGGRGGADKNTSSYIHGAILAGFSKIGVNPFFFARLRVEGLLVNHNHFVQLTVWFNTFTFLVRKHTSPACEQV